MIATSHFFPVAAVAYAGRVNRDFDDPSDEPDDARDNRPAGSAQHDDEIRALVQRLGRPHKSGGRVVERASLLAEGADFDAVMSWIEAHGGEAEAPVAKRATGGLHSARSATHGGRAPTPLRFILPEAALR